jgi:hypothetical protein
MFPPEAVLAFRMLKGHSTKFQVMLMRPRLVEANAEKAVWLRSRSSGPVQEGQLSTTWTMTLVPPVA